MEYEYVITSAYDSNEPHWTQRYENEYSEWYAETVMNEFYKENA